MRKILVLLFLLFSLSTLAACRFGAETRNNVPTFSGVRLAFSEYSEADSSFISTEVQDQYNTINLMSVRRLNTLNRNDDVVNPPGELIGDIYITFVGNKEYFVIEIIQPEEVEDFYVIDSVTISSNVWDKNIKFIRGSGFEENQLKQKHDYKTGMTIVYIPIFINERVSSQAEYQITAIQYLDGSSLRDVRFPEEVERSLEVLIGNRSITITKELLLDTNYIFGGLSEDESQVTFEIENLDGAKILDIFINDELIFTGEHPYTSLNGLVTIDLQGIELTTPRWVKIKIVYDKLDIIELENELILFITDYSHNESRIGAGLLIEDENDLILAMSDIYDYHHFQFTGNMTFSKGFIFKNTTNLQLSSFNLSEGLINLIELNPGENTHLFSNELKALLMANVVFSENIYFHLSHNIIIGLEFVSLRFNIPTESWWTISEQYFGEYVDGKFIPDIEATEIFFNRIIFE